MILRLIDQSFDHKAWHGPTLWGGLRGIQAAEAAWRPGAGRHNIWEIAVHAAYWKYAVRRKLAGLPPGSFPLKGSNWFPRPAELSESSWKADRELLRDQHAALRAAVAKLPEAQLRRVPPGSKTAWIDLLLGIAAHDLYHAGQIQLLKRLRRTS